MNEIECYPHNNWIDVLFEIELTSHWLILFIVIYVYLLLTSRLVHAPPIPIILLATTHPIPLLHVKWILDIVEGGRVERREEKGEEGEEREGNYRWMENINESLWNILWICVITDELYCIVMCVLNCWMLWYVAIEWMRRGTVGKRGEGRKEIRIFTNGISVYNECV
jgi:hypothetical protein